MKLEIRIAGRVLLGVIALGLGVIFLKSFGILTAELTSKLVSKSKTDGIDAALLKQVAADVNKKLPKMIDAVTRFDSTAVIKGTFRYNNTLVNHSAKELNATAFKRAIRAKLVNRVCTKQEMGMFVKYKIPVSYAYYGKNGKEIAVIKVLTSKCRDRN